MIQSEKQTAWISEAHALAQNSVHSIPVDTSRVPYTQQKNR